jgi:hypothetical protein
LLVVERQSAIASFFFGKYFEWAYTHNGDWISENGPKQGVKGTKQPQGRMEGHISLACVLIGP